MINVYIFSFIYSSSFPGLPTWRRLVISTGGASGRGASVLSTLSWVADLWFQIVVSSGCALGRNGFNNFEWLNKSHRS